MNTTATTSAPASPPYLAEVHSHTFVPGPRNIFVFGSNTAGIHGAGAARFAREECGAVYGQGVGLQGHSYAIPTKGLLRSTIPRSTALRAGLVTLSLPEIAGHVAIFKAFAASRFDLNFFVTNIGCGLAGYTPANIAPLFVGAPDNCEFSPEFTTLLKDFK